MSCFTGANVQMYLFEYSIECIKLTAGKYREEFSRCPPTVKLKFIDLPVLELQVKEDEIPSPDEDYDEHEGLPVNRGQFCIFLMKPRDLLDKINSTPLKLSLFRCNESFAIVEATARFPGCLCNQIVVSEDYKRYDFTDTIELLDPGRNYAGTIQFSVYLTGLGSSLTEDDLKSQLKHDISL